MQPVQHPPVSGVRKAVREMVRDSQVQMLELREWVQMLRKNISPALRALGEEHMASDSTTTLLSQLESEDLREMMPIALPARVPKALRKIHGRSLPAWLQQMYER